MPNAAAKSPEVEWNDLRYVLAVARAQAIAPAAKNLRVNETTVLRRLARAEMSLGSKLFDRLAGVLVLTTAGHLVMAHAERVEAEIERLQRLASGSDSSFSGIVRVTSIPLIVNHLLIPALPALYAAHSGLRLEIIADARNLSLTRRDTDIALRLARPDREQRVIARRIGDLPYALYGFAHEKHQTEAWISYESGMAALPHVSWIDEAVKHEPGATVVLTVNDSETALHAIQAGVGKSLLPCLVGDGLPALRRLSGPKPVLSRELWLMVLPEARDLARTRVVSTWLEELGRKLSGGTKDNRQDRAGSPPPGRRHSRSC